MREYRLFARLGCLFALGLFLTAFAARVEAAAVTVREPAFGLPHIYADTDLELARENGRQTARDRLGQMVLVARVGRGTLFQVFAALDPGTLNDDIEARQTAYTSSELNAMFERLPQADQDLLLEYCKGVNDTIDAVYAGTLPKPIEVSVVQALGFSNDLFGNATNISDQIDPFYKAPGGADPERPNGGFQFTPELAVAIGILQVRNFGLNSFDEPSRLSELQALIDKFGMTSGAEIWDDRNFLNDPLAPISVPDATTPGFGGPLAAAKTKKTTQLASVAKKFPSYDYAEGMRRLEERQNRRAEFAARLGAWPMLGSYAWMIGGGKSASGYPWIGGFPQTGIQTPSIMHFMENRSAEGSDHRIAGVGMEFVGAPFILIGQTDSVAFTTTTAQLRIIDTFFEEIISENTNAVRYDDEGAPAALSKRTETFRGGSNPTRVFWRSHARGGNGGSRPVIDFIGDAEGSVTGATMTTLTSTGAFGASFGGGAVLIVDGLGAGQIRLISSATSDTLTLGTAWATTPNATSKFVAVESGNTIVAAAVDSPAWLEETTTVLGFALFQRAETILDIRDAVRVIPSTHNFLAADNKTANGIGTSSGTGGNIGYWSSGFSRVRQGALDPRLPLDGTGPNPLVAFNGTVSSATDTTLTATAAVFGASDLSAAAVNFRYDNPTLQGSEYIVSITSGTGYKQTRRIDSNTTDSLTIEKEWGVVPDPEDTFEVYEIPAMPEVVNPSELYTANWNNKAATADEGDNFGRQFRHAFILERLAAENAWDRDKQRQLNEDVAGLDGKGKFGRFLIPRLRDAVDAVGNGGNGDVDTVLAALEAHNDTPFFGRLFVDPVTSLTTKGEVNFLNSLVNQLAQDIYGDEYAGAISVPGGSDGLNIVQHAIDSAAGDVAGSYTQAYAGDYFNGGGWETVVRDSLSGLASGGIPADPAREIRNYRHPLYGAFIELELPEDAAELDFEPTLRGNRGTYEQIVEVGPLVRGEFIFPLGQSGLIQGNLGGVSSVDPNFITLQPIWRDWRFVPMLAVGQELAAGGDPDGDGDGAWDGYERWYFGDTSHGKRSDDDGDKSKLFQEFAAGSAPNVFDTDGDGIPDGRDSLPQDRLGSGVLKHRTKIKYGDVSGTDKLIFVVKLGAGAEEFDPDTRDISVTLSDDNEIYSVTIPAGTMESRSNGKRFVFNDATGTQLNGIFKAVFVVSKPKGKATLRFKTIEMNLSAANKDFHDVTTEIEFGAHSISDTRLWDYSFDRNLLKPLVP